jgi:CheY-like chemotaxis protein
MVHQALEFTNGSKMPDLIVADYNLPNGITGLESIARLQARASTMRIVPHAGTSLGISA